LKEFHVLLKAHFQLREAEDYRNGLLVSTLYNIHDDSGRTWQPKDFMPDYGLDDQTGEQKDWVSIKQKAELLNALFGGTERPV